MPILAYAVTTAGTGMSALASAVDETPDIIVLDLGLPDIDGLRVLTMLRAVSSVPVVVATARDDERAIIAALDAGADDYLVKPFDLFELSARINAVGRRYAGNPNPLVSIGDLDVDLAARSVRRQGRPVQLPVVGEDVRPERRHHLGEPIGAGRHRLAGKEVRIDDDGPQLDEHGRDGALAGGDAPGEGDPQPHQASGSSGSVASSRCCR